VPDSNIKARFIQPMLLLGAEKLPEGATWVYELDGFRAQAIKTGRVHLRSRNDKDFNLSTPYSSRLWLRCPMRPSSTARSSRWTNGENSLICSPGMERLPVKMLVVRDSTLIRSL
jgi:hypothetical protein